MSKCRCVFESEANLEFTSQKIPIAAQDFLALKLSFLPNLSDLSDLSTNCQMSEVFDSL